MLFLHFLFKEMIFAYVDVFDVMISLDLSFEVMGFYQF